MVLRVAVLLVLLFAVGSVDAQTFDHSSFDQLLRKHVTRDGWVNYKGLQREARQLDAYLNALDKADVSALSRDEQLAFWINAYNAATLRLILDHYPLKSIMDIPEAERWKARRWHLGGKVYTLDEIENKQIRPVFNEPRIHFAVNCASIGCPPLRKEAYTGAKLDKQLTEQAKLVHNDKRFVQVSGDRIMLSKLYEWYGKDFEKDGKPAVAYAGYYNAAIARRLKGGKSPKIEWLDYDWTLNSVDNRK